MFPVSLQFKDGSFMSVHPPCYGFLREEQWECGDEYLREGRHYNSGSYSGGDTNEYDLSEVSSIWNTGTHLGIMHSGGVYPVQNIYSDMVAVWAAARDKKVTMKDVMEKFESYLDKDSESCLLWAEEGCMGVRSDIPCDRALFYLMLNRMLFTSHESNVVNRLLDMIYLEDVPPVVALLVTRIVVPATVFGRTKNVWCGSDGDSCILPISLIYKGMGALYLKPIQLEWHQHSYSTGQGHHRDEDLPAAVQVYGEDSRWCSRSMFDAIFQNTYICGGNSEEEDPVLSDLKGNPVHSIAIDFAKEIFTEEAFKDHMYGCEYGGGSFNYHRLTGRMHSINEDHLKLSNDKWGDLAKALILGE